MELANYNVLSWEHFCCQNIPCSCKGTRINLAMYFLLLAQENNILVSLYKNFNLKISLVKINGHKVLRFTVLTFTVYHTSEVCLEACYCDEEAKF